MIKILLISIIICFILFFIIKIGFYTKSPSELAFMKLTNTYPAWMIICTLLWMLSIIEVIIVAIITIIKL